MTAKASPQAQAAVGQHLAELWDATAAVRDAWIVDAHKTRATVTPRWRDLSAAEKTIFRDLAFNHARGLLAIVNAVTEVSQ